MRLRFFVLGVCAGATFLAAGCKSTQTTSAILHNQHGRHDLAIQTAGEALANNPNDAEAHFQLALAYSSLDSVLDKAYEHFTKSAELDPKRADMVDSNIRSNYARHYNKALPMVGNPNASMDELSQAAEEFQTATKADPRESKAYYMLGQVYARMGNQDPSYYDKAIPELDKVLELGTPADKHYIDALSLAGEVLARSGRPEEARSRFHRLVEEDPTNYHVIENIGYDLLNESEWKGAVVFLDLAAQARGKIGADDFDLFYNIGVAHYNLGLPARQAAREESGKDTPDEEAYMKYMTETQEAMNTAVGYFERALTITPDEPQTVFQIARAYLVAEDWRSSVTWGEKYIGLNPEDPNGWRLLGTAYGEVGDRDKARQCLARYETLLGGGGGSK